MGLFFGGLRRQIEALTNELETLRKTAAEAKKETTQLGKELKERDESIRREREGRKKTEQKVTKLTKAKQDSDQKNQAQNEQIEHLESELALFRKSMLDARAESESLKARLMKFERVDVPVTKSAEDEGEQAQDEEPAKTEAPAPRTQSPQQVDRRIERLEELLSQERENRDELKDRLSRAEGGRRDADRRRVSEANKFEAVIRDLEHGIRSERRAYKVLQLQYEAQLERVRGMDQGGEPTETPENAAVEADDAVPVTESTEAEATPTEAPSVEAEANDAAPAEDTGAEAIEANPEEEKADSETTAEG